MTKNKKKCVQPMIRILSFPVVFTCFTFLVFTTSGHAQLLPNYGVSAPLEQDMRFREWSLERLKKQKALVPEDQKLAFMQLNKDFTDLQLLNNDLIKARTTGGDLDYSLISQKTRQIYKTATRLSTNLKLPKPENIQQKPDLSANPAVNLTAVLFILDTVIFKFVKNPIFKNIEIIDVNDALMAKEDLDRIVFLSERARKKSESLSKDTTKH